MKNYCPQTLTFVDATTHAQIASFPSVGVAKAVPGSSIDMGTISAIPVVAFTRPARVEGLPDSDDEAIIVPAIVADAMKQLGLRHRAGVYSPQQLLFDADRRPIGAPGLIFHSDLS